MAPPAGTLRVGRYFTALLLLMAVLYSIVALGSRHTPKLGIDLVGGKRVIFTALSPKGSPAPTSSQMTQARQIIEDRINGTGVTGATVQVQGNNQLVVLIPGGTETDVAKLGKAAVLNFRGVMAPAQAVACTTGAAVTPGTSTPATSSSATSSGASTPAATPSTPAAKAGSSAAAANDASHRQLAAAPSRASSPAKARASSPAKRTTRSTATSPAESSTGTAGAATSPSTGSTSAATAPRCVADPIAAAIKADPTLAKVLPNAEACPSPALPSGATCAAYSSLSATEQQELAGALQRFNCAAAQNELDDASKYYLACDTSQGAPIAYLLGHVIVPGRGISSASAQAPTTSGNGGSSEWTVSLTLGGSGADSWNSWTSKYHTSDTSVSPLQTSATAPCGPTAAIPCSDFVAFTLDGEVLSAPVTTAVLDRQTSISGSFTQSSANDLARELNYGKLPLSFRTDANQSVSATLGSEQLNAAFVAGGIGLALVVIYSLLYYRGLGIITIASLLVSAVLTYAMLVLLGTQIGFTLDLAGIAGFIVALGITADSFVVFFERIKDEVHEGRSMRVAVPRAWVRARRTILSADTVSFLAAAILYYFASADVKGFAFTLGMSTILDLVVVFLFTHPIVSVLSRSRTFGSPRFTGLNSVRVGGIVDDELPARSARRSRPARSNTVSTPEQSRAGRSRSTTAVIDDDESLETDVTDDDVLSRSDPAEAAEVESPDAGDTVAASGEDEPEQPQRSGTSSAAGGTAAERAAARRARMRGKRDEEGTS